MLKAIKELFAQRRARTETIKPYVYLNFYYSMNQKIDQEERALLQLLNLEDQRQRVRERYTNVLDQQYFEQKFL